MKPKTPLDHLIECSAIEFYLYSDAIKLWLDSLLVSELLILLSYWDMKSISTTRDEFGEMISADTIRSSISGLIRYHLNLTEIKLLKEKLTSVISSWSPDEQKIAKKHLQFLN